MPFLYFVLMSFAPVVPVYAAAHRKRGKGRRVCIGDSAATMRWPR